MALNNLLIYGATGYTGKLVADAAKAQGLNPVLAGRSEAKVRPIAERLGLTWRAFALDDAPSLDRALAEVAAVLHIAGPFSATSKPMVDACLRTGRHYLDITGEIDVFEACAARSAEAKARGVMLLPGVGFDVVPSDCLAAHVARRLPGAKRLTIGISGMGKASRGTAKTMVESLGTGTRVRRGGHLVSLPKAPSRQIDYGQGPTLSVGVSWGDVATAWHSTAIPDIDVFFEAAGPIKRMANAGALTQWFLRQGWMKRFLKGRINAMPEGPTDAERAASSHVLIAEASDARGNAVRSRLATPEGYTLTSRAALSIAQKVCSGQFKPGFQTPSLAYGPDLILEFDGCRREDLNA
jgi:short subunit dehydrogenase-like uncharacterized protein